MHSHAGFERADAALAEAAAAWMPTADLQARAMILDFLRQAAETGLNPLSALRENLRSWFGPKAGAALPAFSQAVTPDTPGNMTIESLAPLRRPTMWPQRPKRLPDELFSSWLWRTSVTAGIPPIKFIRDMPSLPLANIDRDVAPATLRRLAQRTGQSAAHLAAGTISIAFTAADDTPAGVIEAVLLRDGRFLPLKDGSASSNRRRKCLQYCPLCLITDARPHFRRAWRFSLSIVCPEHGCRLHDGCPHCGAPIDLMAQHHIGLQPRCASCEIRLCETGVIAAPMGTRRQRSLNAFLLYLGIHIAPLERRRHLDALHQHFRGAPGDTAAARVRALLDLAPSTPDRWFARPQRLEHVAPLRMLARGMPYEQWLLRSNQQPPAYSYLMRQNFAVSVARAYCGPSHRRVRRL